MESEIQGFGEERSDMNYSGVSLFFFRQLKTKNE